MIPRLMAARPQMDAKNKMAGISDQRSNFFDAFLRGERVNTTQVDLYIHPKLSICHLHIDKVSYVGGSVLVVLHVLYLHVRCNTFFDVYCVVKYNVEKTKFVMYVMFC